MRGNGAGAAVVPCSGVPPHPCPLQNREGGFVPCPQIIKYFHLTKLENNQVEQEAIKLVAVT